VRAGGALKVGLLSLQRSVTHRIGFVASILMLTTMTAFAAGETRSLTLHNIHTHENLTITYKKNGEFDSAALKRLNTFFRDWRQEKEVVMEPQLFDMLWEVHREVKASGPIHVVCGYRSPNTNEMLRSRSRSTGVAKTSLHMQGKAIDFSIPSANVADVRAAALRIQGGGVGYYPTSGIPFVHMDVGNVRHWPRMTKDQLARVFPDGRTLHVSTSGPLQGYEQAMANAERNGGRRPYTIDQPKPGLLASLFGRKQQDPEEADDNTSTKQAPAPRRTPAVVAAATAAPTPAAAPVAQAAAPAPEPAAIPLPPSRPTYQIASADSRSVPAPAARAVRVTNLASLTPNQIIEARGYWQGLPEIPRETTGVNISSARRTASADITASIGPFGRNDRVAPDLALAYAAQADSVATPDGTAALRGAMVLHQGRASSIAVKPPSADVPEARAVKTDEKLNDPWVRGLVIAPSVQTSMVTTTFGVPDFRSLSPFIRKPAASVVMTFNHDPHLGMSYDEFTGSAVVFQATVTFGMKTAALKPQQ
jgi:uncharacterized protein YcbK (DUF882 family)